MKAILTARCATEAACVTANPNASKSRAQAVGSAQTAPASCYDAARVGRGYHMRRHQGIGWAIAALLASTSVLAAPATQPWIEESNRHAALLMDVRARYEPERASAAGAEGHDTEVLDLKPGYAQREQSDLGGAVAELQRRLPEARDPRVKQDLQILIDAGTRERGSIELQQSLMLPYFDLGRTLFESFHALLDPRVPKQRQAAALVRLRRYVGGERGYQPIATLARARVEERLGDASLTGPWNVEVEQHLRNQPQYLKGIEDLFRSSGLHGWQRDLDTLTSQLGSYAGWVRTTVLPRARSTNRLPPQIYADNLRQVGVLMDPHEIIERALYVYAQTREEMQSLAAQVAAQHGFKSADYHDVIRELKKERIPDDKLLEFYRERLSSIESILRRERLISLPERKAVIRLATPAESASQPAPHMSPPRLIGNTGEPAIFVLPTSNPNSETHAEYDDFNYDAIAWTLTAHEARPGHELQFASMLEHGVSTARAVFAFNSANVEGWALYAEAFMKPYVPLDGQLGVLQMRLMRAARAFLDPMLNLGMIEPEAAKRLLMEEVVLSEPMARQEVDRYTFNAPGQATSYFYGYTQLEALRARAELALGSQFEPRAYHDFIIDQGLLPLALLQTAVMEEFVPAHRTGH
jgi:hypothetical protein